MFVFSSESHLAWFLRERSVCQSLCIFALIFKASISYIKISVIITSVCFLHALFIAKLSVQTLLGKCVDFKSSHMQPPLALPISVHVHVYSSFNHYDAAHVASQLMWEVYVCKWRPQALGSVHTFGLGLQSCDIQSLLNPTCYCKPLETVGSVL